MEGITIALRVAEDFRQNALIGRAHNFVKDISRIVKAFDDIRLGLCVVRIEFPGLGGIRIRILCVGGVSCCVTRPR